MRQNEDVEYYTDTTACQERDSYSITARTLPTQQTTQKHNGTHIYGILPLLELEGFSLTFF